jgi:hypothetical protein
MNNECSENSMADAMVKLFPFFLENSTCPTSLFMFSVAHTISLRCSFCCCVVQPKCIDGILLCSKKAPTRCKRKPHPLAIALVRNVIGWGPNQLHEMKNRKQIKGFFTIMTIEGEIGATSTWITINGWRLAKFPQQLTPFKLSATQTCMLKSFHIAETFPPAREISAQRVARIFLSTLLYHYLP